MRYLATCVARKKRIFGTDPNLGTHIKKAVAEFLPHLEFWKEHGLEKFILLVAYNVDDRNVLDAKREYEREKKIRCLSEKRAALTSRWGTSKKGLIC